MASDNNIKNFTAFDIERYHKGLLSSKERHDLEKAALDDPFLADALEGYAITGADTTADTIDLRNRLAERTQAEKVVTMRGGKSSFPWLRAAAVIVVVTGSGLLFYLLNSPAKNNNPVANLRLPDTAKVSIADTSLKITAGTGSYLHVDTLAANTRFAWTQTDSLKTLHQGLVNIETQRTPETYRPIVNDSIRFFNTAPGSTVIADNKQIKTDSIGKGENNDLAILKPKAADEKRKDDKFNDASVLKGIKDEETYYSKEKAAGKRAIADNNNMQNRLNVFRGRVTDAENNGVPFANVTNTQDNVGTYSDAKGNFTLVSPDSVLNVQIRSIGFNSNNLQLRNSPVIGNQIVMQEDKTLNETVISTKKPNTEARSRGSMKLEEPEPADGWSNYDAYLANNLNIPEEIKTKKSSEGEVELSFEVDKKGEPVNIKIEKSLCAKCDQEAIRLIKEGPKWKRKAKKGRTIVTVPFSNSF